MCPLSNLFQGPTVFCHDLISSRSHSEPGSKDFTCDSRDATFLLKAGQAGLAFCHPFSLNQSSSPWLESLCREGFKQLFCRVPPLDGNSGIHITKICHISVLEKTSNLGTIRLTDACTTFAWPKGH